jgi:carbonic anhydrase
MRPLLDAKAAYARLKDGNRRYASDVRSLESLLSHTKRAAAAASQTPVAIVLGCSDSRAPAEVVFDQGLGDLFVIRVAGNIVAPSQVGSVEFAAAQFGTRLVVVMGHSRCGAISATIDALRGDGASDAASQKNIRAIVDRVRPAVEPLLRDEVASDRAKLTAAAVRANVRASADHLRHGSEILEDLIRNDGLRVVGAEYALETGEVEFFDVPDDLKDV